MPEIVISGEKKKVACGPCIRGHRSSKCTHKDRVLIEVRKPGRPLSTCPHPAGKCNCDRLVINYTIPKSLECPCPTPTPTLPTVTAARIQKSRTRKSSITPSNLQKAIDGDPTALVQSTSQPIKVDQPDPSDTSSNGPSTPSSASSTPRTESADKPHVSQASTPFSSDSIKPKPQSTELPLRTIGAGGYGESHGTTGFTWNQKDFHGNSQDALIQPPQQSPTCCSTSRMHQPQKSNSNVQQNLSGPQPSCCNNSQVGDSYPLETNVTDPFAIPDVSMDQFSLLTSMESLSGQQTHALAMSMPTQQQLSNSLNDHGCHCGDSCACIGCAAHPRNQRTIEYVRYHNELATRLEQERSRLPIPLNDPFQHAPPLPQGNTYSLDNLSRMAFTNNIPQSQYGSLFSTVNAMDPNYSMAFFGGAAWALDNLAQSFTPATWSELENAHLHSSSHHNMISPNEISGFYAPDNESQHHPENIQPVVPKSGSSENQHNWDHDYTEEVWVSPGRASESRTNFLDAESPEDNDSPSVLSPSAFLPLSVTLEGCDEGACQCGDKCECQACLIHNDTEVHDNNTEAKL